VGRPFPPGFGGVSGNPSLPDEEDEFAEHEFLDDVDDAQFGVLDVEIELLGQRLGDLGELDVRLGGFGQDELAGDGPP
jgi:hypothetical protein